MTTITLGAASHPQLRAQEVSNQAPAASGGQSSSLAQPSSSAELPAGPEETARRYPDAIVEPAQDDGSTVVIESSGPQAKTGSKYTLDGDVVITYKDRKVEADHIDYDAETGDLNASGHLKVTGGENNESISASHGTMNLKTETGRFFDVSGSVGLRSSGLKAAGRRPVYDNGQPFLFEGKVVVKTGPKEYDVYGGSVTSCQLPHPDWQLFAGKFSVTEEKATARNTVFRVMDIPLVYLPYVSHPVGDEQRQTGFMIPVIGQSSTKGLVLGEQIYVVLGRSTDMTVGAEYFSKRGWQQSATLRYRGLGNDFALAHYNGLQDRGFYSGGQYVNQGGEDVVFSGRHDWTSQTRVVADVEYLSSYPYREAFTENFNQAVSSDILSEAYAVHQTDGYSWALRADRYQGLKQAATPTTAEQQIRIFHAPSLDLATTEHRLGDASALWSVQSTAAGLKRVQPDFSTTGLTERFDLRPEIALPLNAGGWRFRSSLALRETIYSRSREPSLSPVPVESGEAVNRADLEVGVEARAPVLERTFRSPLVGKLFGADAVKHTIEPMAAYLYVTGIHNFNEVLRFDDVDVVSNTNEVEYGVTQRLFLRPKKSAPCETPDTDAAAGSGAWTGAAAPGAMGGVGGNVASDAGYTAASGGCGSRELLSWRVTQKYFFNPSFGGAVVTGRRNIFTTTLALSGVAFLTEPREISPLISRLRWRTSDHFDVEWDWDLDTGAKKFTSNNVLVNFHEGNVFSGLSYARLNAPGRFNIAGFSSAVSDFKQLRVLLGYGGPTKRGFGVAANAGLDLNSTQVQYGALQVQYNWDCCGLSVEYRKYELGSVRNENVYRFNFTLANIGTAGNLRRAERLF
ncbi:LPS-assembly protein LptD [Edaphobacter aggregans]|uniref:LPS-assembly protein LptD n=1 Tax=Edaphobacter aggregans TaxID=570835 RepID=UPI001FDFEB61|nr:LPS assembly protein LptD [Edaphobacter aggregans]